MNYTDIDFAFFLPVVFCVYWLLPRTRRWQNGYLLLASYAFYASWSPRLLSVLLLSTAVDYAVGLYLAAHPDDPRRRRGALLVSLIYNIAQLCFFKYAGFFAESLNDLLRTLHVPGSLPVLKLVLPVGISFYTFQKISYVLDVYDGREPACRSPLDFALFCAFFPQIVAGPIVRAGELLPQLAAPRRLDAAGIDRLRGGCAVFLLGFFKKAYLAEYLGQYLVQPVFQSPGSYSAAGHWLALLGYGAQIFCDFSGYSEMAIGCARLFGIELPANFNYPYLSKNLIEFWRRWHITLNRFLFDYIYGPLTTGHGLLRGRLDLGFLLVFLLSGLWHGARWTFVAWGLLHAVALIVTRRYDERYRGLCRKDRAWVRRRKSAAYGAVAWALTQLFFLLTLIPFRAPSLADALGFARGLVSSPGRQLLPDKAPYLRDPSFALCAALLVAYHLLEATGPGRRLRESFFALPALVRGAAYGLTIAFLFVFMPLSSGTFIYALF
jgi:alginate O-acetyltransferase complex protein AlgI